MVILHSLILQNIFQPYNCYGQHMDTYAQIISNMVTRQCHHVSGA